MKAYDSMKKHLIIMKKNQDASIINKVAVFVNSCYLIKESLNGRMLIEQPEGRIKKEYL